MSYKYFLLAGLLITFYCIVFVLFPKDLNLTKYGHHSRTYTFPVIYS